MIMTAVTVALKKGEICIFMPTPVLKETCRLSVFELDNKNTTLVKMSVFIVEMLTLFAIVLREEKSRETK